MRDSLRRLVQLVALSFCLALNSYATAALSEQDVRVKLLSQDTRLIKEAGQNMSYASRATGTQANLDIAAAILEEPKSYTTKLDIDALAWLCKAIGLSHNPRYYDLLQHVEDNKTLHRKIRKNAKRARKEIGTPNGNTAFSASEINVEALSKAVNPESYDKYYIRGRHTAKHDLTEKERVIFDLSIGPKTQITSAIKLAKERHKDDQLVMDTIAQFLLEQHTQPFSIGHDTLSWAVIALGESTNSRYFSIINRIASGHPNSRIQRHAVVALTKLKQDRSKQYKFGEINLVQIGKSYAQL